MIVLAVLGLALLICILLVGIIIVIELNPQPTTASASASGYSLVKSHEITGSQDGAQSNYQVKFVIHRGNGTDSGQDVYLNGHSLSWPYDFRFANNTNVPLSYWIESYDPDMATVWVKVDGIPASPDAVPIKLYYGKANDAGASNGDATFTFFDDFNGGDYTDKWQPGAGSWVESDGMLTRVTAPSDGSLYVTGKTIGNGAIRCRYRQISDSSTDCPGCGIIARASGSGNPSDGYQFEVNRMPDNRFRILKINGWTPIVTQSMPIQLDQWYVLDAKMYGDSLKMELDGTVISGSNTALSSGKYGLRFWNARGDIDWYLVRNYTLNEPKHGAWGAEASV